MRSAPRASRWPARAVRLAFAGGLGDVRRARRGLGRAAESASRSMSQLNGRTSSGSIRAISYLGMRSFATTAGSSSKVAVSVGLKRPKWTWQPVALPVAPS